MQPLLPAVRGFLWLTLPGNFMQEAGAPHPLVQWDWQAIAGDHSREASREASLEAMAEQRRQQARAAMQASGLPFPPPGVLYEESSDGAHGAQSAPDGQAEPSAQDNSAIVEMLIGRQLPFNARVSQPLITNPMILLDACGQKLKADTSFLMLMSAVAHHHKDQAPYSSCSLLARYLPLCLLCTENARVSCRRRASTLHCQRQRHQKRLINRMPR